MKQTEMKTAMAFIVALALIGVQLGHLMYGDHEFERANAEWDVAHAKGDVDAELAAYHKEVIAHCKTIDFLWFLHNDDFCNDARHP